MPRIAVIDRAAMNAEQARVYDAAKAGSGIVGGPYTAYIRLPKLFEAAQNMRAPASPTARCRRASSRSSISPSPVLGRALSVVRPGAPLARRRLPQSAIDAINARKTPDLADAREKTC